MEIIINAASSRLEVLLQHVEAGHGIMHARTVLQNCKHALAAKDYALKSHQVLAVQLAALLHDADDHKLFKTYQGNARAITTAALVDWPDREEASDITELVVYMIGLVGASSNKKTYDGPEWHVLPRDSDRLEALGWIGVVRCYQYTVHTNRPLFTDATPRVTSYEELAKVATPERFRAYTGDSASMIDHYYDKIIHVSTLETLNPWLVEQAATRRRVIAEFLFDFGRTGVIDVTTIV